MAMSREDKLQIEVMNYIRTKYPSVLAIHVANERFTSAMRGSKLKQMGVTSGCSDILIFQAKMTQITDGVHGVAIDVVGHCGLSIELKAINGKGVRPKPTASQIEFMDRLKDCGWKVAVHWTFEEAKNEIDKYLRE